MLFIHMKKKNCCCQIPSVWRAFSKKLRFRDGVVWTVGLTVEINLRFHDVDSEPTWNETLKWLWNCTVESQSCNGFLFLSYFLDYLLIIVDYCSPRTEDKYHLLVRIHINNVHAWFLSTEDFADEFRRKGIVFNRALEDLEDRAKKCESLKNLVS